MIAVLAVDRKQFICFVDSYVDHLASWADPKSFDAGIVRCQFEYIESPLKINASATYELLVHLDGWQKVPKAIIMDAMLQIRVRRPSSK